MDPVNLHYSTGYKQIDDTIRGIIGIFELAFPGRIRCYYLVGSYADDSFTPISDIDIRIIFKDELKPGEEEQMRQLRTYCRLISPIAIDCPPLCETRLLHDENWLHEPLGIKAYGQLLFGQEIRHTFPEPDFNAYVRNVTTVPVDRFARIRHQSRLIYPLTYPDPEGEFFGYDDKVGPAWNKVSSTKSLVHMIGFAATCLIALQAGQMVVQKSDWLKMYQEAINDQWTSYLEDIYQLCKEAWLYRIPESQDERSQLRAICQQTLPFENYYLACYRSYLFAERQSEQSNRRRYAVEQLKKLTYPGDEIDTPNS